LCEKEIDPVTQKWTSGVVVVVVVVAAAAGAAVELVVAPAANVNVRSYGQRKRLISVNHFACLPVCKLQCNIQQQYISSGTIAP